MTAAVSTDGTAAARLADVRTWKLVAPVGLLFGMNISLLFTAVTRTVAWLS